MGNKKLNVVVIGAGIAGLTTAYRLHQAGIEVEVYEARNRVGGRILTASVCDHIAELGAKNIGDGGEAKNLLHLIKELGLEVVKGQVNLKHSYFNEGNLIPLQEILSQKHFQPESLKAQLKDLAQRSQNMREVLNGLFQEEDPLYKSIAVRLAAYEGGSIEELSSLYTETLYHMLLGGIAAAHQNKGEENYINLSSIEGGNALLPEKIATILHQRLHLNQPLKRISRDRDSYVLTFQDHLQVKADILVLAMPCSVYEEINFEENILPVDRLKAIRNVRYGTNAKILVPFHPFPMKKVALINNRVIGSFFDIDCKTLTLYYTGAASHFSKETILQTYEQDRPMLEKEFGTICPPLVTPVMAKDQNFSAYEGPVGYSWPNDPYAKGSYAYIASQQETVLTAITEEQGECVKTLFAPVDRKLYFAGEHTSILTEVPGTMEAACESGERTARLILKH